MIGIVWLIPIFGVYFASGLCNRGQGPAKGGWKVALWALIGLVAAMAGAAATFSTLGSGPVSVLVVGPLFLAIAFLIVRGAWPQLFSTLLFYGLSARIPVVIVAFLAMAGNWGTHYELGPPDFPQFGLLQKWFLLGLFPQLTFWVGFTVIIGTLFGGITAALKKA